MKKFLMTALFMIALITAGKTLALDPEVFDSTNNYTGACQLTDKSEWTLAEDLNVTTFQIWYKWNEGETTLPITVYKDGAEFAKFTATRTTCDTYQKNWCNADYAINKVFPKGAYTTQISAKQQCLKPGSTGTVRLYGNKDTSDISRSGEVTSTANGCEKTRCTGSIVTYAAISFAVGAGIFYFIGKKF